MDTSRCQNLTHYSVHFRELSCRVPESDKFLSLYEDSTCEAHVASIPWSMDWLPWKKCKCQSKRCRTLGSPRHERNTYYVLFGTRTTSIHGSTENSFQGREFYSWDVTEAQSTALIHVSQALMEELKAGFKECELCSRIIDGQAAKLFGVWAAHTRIDRQRYKKVGDFYCPCSY